MQIEHSYMEMPSTDLAYLIAGMGDEGRRRFETHCFFIYSEVVWSQLEMCKEHIAPNHSDSFCPCSKSSLSDLLIISNPSNAIDDMPVNKPI